MGSRTLALENSVLLLLDDKDDVPRDGVRLPEAERAEGGRDDQKPLLTQYLSRVQMAP